MLRVPEWCREASISVNGQNVSLDERARGYVQISRAWKQGDVIELKLAMPVQPVRANPLVQADVGRAALTRGPLVYCVESADNGEPTRSLAIQSGAKFTSEFRKDFLGG